MCTLIEAKLHSLHQAKQYMAVLIRFTWEYMYCFVAYEYHIDSKTVLHHCMENKPYSLGVRITVSVLKQKLSKPDDIILASNYIPQANVVQSLKAIEY